MGLELLAEAGNYVALQNLYPGYPNWPNYPGPSPAALPLRSAPSAAELFYRQQAAVSAAVSTLQKPLAYRLYPPGMGLLPGPSSGMPGGLPPPGPALAASTSLASLSSYYNSPPGGHPPPAHFGAPHRSPLRSPLRSPSPEQHPHSPRTPESRHGSVDVEEDSNDSRVGEV